MDGATCPPEFADQRRKRYPSDRFRKGSTHPARSFDNLVGAQQYRRRYLDAERSGGLQVDDRLEPRRLLDRDVGRVSTLQYPVDENGGAAKHGGEVHPVTHRGGSPGSDNGRGNRWHAALVDN